MPSYIINRNIYLFSSSSSLYIFNLRGTRQTFLHHHLCQCKFLIHYRISFSSNYPHAMIIFLYNTYVMFSCNIHISCKRITFVPTFVFWGVGVQFKHEYSTHKKCNVALCLNLKTWRIPKISYPYFEKGIYHNLKFDRLISYININISWKCYSYRLVNTNFIVKILTRIKIIKHINEFLRTLKDR